MLNPAAPAPVAPPTVAAASSEALPPGTRLGEFEILRVLGSGGFGTVYLAHDHALDRAVAIKEYLPEQLARRVGRLQVAVRSAAHADTYAAGLKSFVGEARILARFNHAAMVKVYRYWEANGTGYMVMPHVQGPTLREWRRSLAAPPTEGMLRAIVDPLLDALTLLHAEGIYHRDLAPDNVLLPAEDQPVLLDFGAARRVIGDHTRTLTAMLKPSFAPIEQYGEAAQLRQGPWTDLYALGAAIVYLLDAAPPPPATVRAMHDDMPALAERSIPGVSRCFLQAVQWALAVRPQDRPQSVQEFRNALDGRLQPPRRAAADGGAQLHVLPAAQAAPAMPVPAAVPMTHHAHARTISEPRPAAWHTQDGALEAPVPATLDLPAPPAALAAAPSVSMPTPMTLPASAAAGVDAEERSRSLALGAFGLATAAVLVIGVLWSRNVTLPGTAELPPRARGAAAQLEAPAGAAPGQRAATRNAESSKPARAQPATRNAAPTASPRPANGDADSEFAIATRTGAVPATSPAEACADRENLFSRSWCIGMRCNEQRFAEHPQCVQLRKDQQRDRGPGLP